MRNWLKLGSWNTICDLCGRKYKAEDLRRNWRGLMVCKEDFEERNQQELIRARRDKQAVDYARPESPTPTYVADTCDFWSSSQMADFGTADCMYIGSNTSIERLIDIYGVSSRAGIAIAGRSISGVY